MPRLPQVDLDHVLTHTSGVWNAFAGARVFITGGTGFVGKWLLETALWANDQLDLNLSIVALTRDPERFRRDHPHLAELRALKLLLGGAQSFKFPEGEFPFVIHAATERYFEPDAARPASTFDLDVAATRHLLEFAASHGTRRFLLTSSGAAYGKQPAELTHIPEDYPGAPSTTDPHTAYGQAKRASEYLSTMYGRQYGFAALPARLFAFVGPHLPLDQNFAVGNFLRNALAGESIQIKGDGTPYRSYLYAADLAIWLWTILVRGESSRLYNVGSDEAVSIAELAHRIVDLVAPRTAIEISGKPEPGTPALRYVPSVERARRELNLQPLISLDQGICRTYEWAGSAMMVEKSY